MSMWLTGLLCRFRNRKRKGRYQNGILKRAERLLILLPEESRHATICAEQLRGILSGKKVDWVCRKEFASVLLPILQGGEVISYSDKDFTWFGVPKGELAAALTRTKPDAVLDMHGGRTRISCTIPAVLPETVFAGMRRDRDEEAYFDFVFLYSDSNSPDLYKNFVNCLQTF
mgnify:CR=1 FL=1